MGQEWNLVKCASENLSDTNMDIKMEKLYAEIKLVHVIVHYVNVMLNSPGNIKVRLMYLIINITCSGQHQMDIQCGIQKIIHQTAQLVVVVHMTHNVARIKQRLLLSFFIMPKQRNVATMEKLSKIEKNVNFRFSVTEQLLPVIL